MEESQGLKEAKELVDLGCNVGELLADLADGVNLSDLAPALKAAKSVAPALKDAGMAFAWYTNASDEEAEALENYMVTEFDIPQDNIEAAVEQIFKAAIEIRGLAQLFVKKP